jgi:hypothetical protein
MRPFIIAALTLFGCNIARAADQFDIDIACSAQPQPICKPSGSTFDFTDVVSFSFGSDNHFTFNVPSFDLDSTQYRFDAGRTSTLAVFTETSPALIETLEFSDITLTAVQLDSQTETDSITFSYDREKMSSTPVPIPTPIALLFAGLGMLGSFLKRKDILHAAAA